MKPEELPAPTEEHDEVAALIQTLHRTEQRLEELTGGEVDTVSSASGHPFVLRRAQEQMRYNDAAKQDAILNALPAHIAMLDAQGVIVSVNEAWRRFGRANLNVAPGHGLGLNYLEVCDQARGQYADESHQVAAGIRAVLEGTAPVFSIEYPCHAPTEPRWFLLMVTPVTGPHPHGAVVMHLNISQRRQAAEELRASEARFAGAFEQAPSGMALVAPDGRWLKVNRALCDLLGYPEAELLTRTFQDITHPEDLAEDLDNVRQLLAGDIRSYEMEKRYLKAQGQPVTVLLNVSLVRDEQNRPVYFIAHIQDITERKQAEDLVQQQQIELRALFNLIPAMIWFKDTKNRILRVNQQVADAAGKTVAEIEGQMSQDIYPQDAARFFADDLAVMHTGAPKLGYVEAVTNPAGKNLWVQTDKVPVRATDGKISGIFVMAQDITERRAVMEALRASNEKFHQLADNITDAFWIRSADLSEVQYVSPAFERIWGRSVSSLLANPQDWSDFILAEDRARVQGAFAALVQDTRTLEIEYRIVRPSGEIRWVHVRGFQVRNEVNAVIRHIGIVRDITAHKQAEVALRQTQDLLTLASSLTHMGAWSVQLPEFILTLSEGARQIHEMPPGFNPTVEEATNFYTPEDRPAVARAIADCVRDGTPFDVELQIVTTTGRRVWVRSIGKAERNATGGIQRINGAIQDITQPKLAQLALRASEKEFRSLAESVPQIVWITRADGWNVFFNQQWMDYTGLTLDESTGHNWIKPFHPDDRPLAADAWQRAVATGSTYSLEVRLRRADGVYHWWLTRGVPIRDAAGTILKWFGTCTDIQEIKLAALALRESEQLFKALFDQAAVGVAQVAAATGRFVKVNQRFCDITGRSRLELEHLTFAAITHPQDLGRDVELMAQMKAGVIREYTREKRYLRLDGTEVWANLTVSAMWAPGEAPGLCIGIVQDITARKLVDEHLLQAQKMEALGQFSGGVAHDFNNILAAISGYTELARMQLEGNPAVRGHLGAVLKATNRAADLVRQILTFSRQQPQTREVVLLQPIVVESMKLMRATIPTTVEIEALIAADAPKVLANANQVHQVLMNLAINGWHALKSHPGRLQVKLENVTVDAAYAAAKPGLRAGTYARLSVCDTGCGMDPATLRRIFEPFFTTKAPGEGTGLGLAVVHGIMESHDGAVTVHSQPGEGTVFRLYFPEHVGDTTPGPGEAGPTPRGDGERVLVVDDEEMLAEMGENLLKRLGYAAESTTTSAQALELVRADPTRFALVLTDQTMPGLTGLQLASRLREIRPDLRLMLMTGYNLSLTAERLGASGISNILHKPFTLHSLGIAVHATLTGKPFHNHDTNTPY